MLRILATALLMLPLSVFARDWQVDPTMSALAFKCSYQGTAFDGKFKKFDATISWDAANLAASKFDVTVDLASADTGNSDRDDALTGVDFFDAGKFPQAHFVTTAFTKSADSTIVAIGNLTIRGQTRPVTLKVMFIETGSTATLDVDTTLKRADYELGASSDWADVGADVPVHAHLLLTGK